MRHKRRLCVNKNSYRRTPPTVTQRPTAESAAVKALIVKAFLVALKPA